MAPSETCHSLIDQGLKDHAAADECSGNQECGWTSIKRIYISIYIMQIGMAILHCRAVFLIRSHEKEFHLDNFDHRFLSNRKVSLNFPVSIETLIQTGVPNFKVIESSVPKPPAPPGNWGQFVIRACKNCNMHAQALRKLRHYMSTCFLITTLFFRRLKFIGRSVSVAAATQIFE